MTPPGFDALALDDALALWRLWVDRATHEYVPLCLEAAGAYDVANELRIVPALPSSLVSFVEHQRKMRRLFERRVMSRLSRSEISRAAFGAWAQTVEDTLVLRTAHSSAAASVPALLEELPALRILGLEAVVAAADLVAMPILEHERRLREGEMSSMRPLN